MPMYPGESYISEGKADYSQGMHSSAIATAPDRGVTATLHGINITTSHQSEIDM